MPHYDADDEIVDEELDERLEQDWDNQPIWQAALPVLAALVVGAIVGLVLGAQFFSSGQASASVNTETCLLLASELYVQGESIDIVQEHLTALGFNNAAPTLLKLADDYASSGEPHKKSQSNDLRQLGEALLVASQNQSTPAVLASGSSTASATQTGTKTVTGVEVTATPKTTGATPTKAAAQTPVPSGTTATTSAPTPTTQTTKPTTTTTTSTSTAVGVSGTGRITSSDGSGAKLRSQPTTNSDVVASLNNGTRVQVLQIVNGEAIDEAEPRWYKVQSGSSVGYVYFKLVVAGE